MKKVCIVHGWEREPQDEWYPWLKNELVKNGFEVFVPEMPDTEEPKIEAWVSTLATVAGEVDFETYFIGHSIGCQTILRYLETQEKTVGGAVFVAGWFMLTNLEDDEVKELACPWLEVPIDLQKVKKVLPNSTLIISDNDPYGCFEENRKKFSEIVTREIIVSGAGHFVSRDGYTKIPIVLEEVKSFEQ